MEKVDVLAEIPYVIRKGLAAVTGTKPYIYQVSPPSLIDCRRDIAVYRMSVVLQADLSVLEPCDIECQARRRGGRRQGMVIQRSHLCLSVVHPTEEPALCESDSTE